MKKQAVRRSTYKISKCVLPSPLANRIKTHLWNQKLPVITPNETSIRALGFRCILKIFPFIL